MPIGGSTRSHSLSLTQKELSIQAGLVFLGVPLPTPLLNTA